MRIKNLFLTAPLLMVAMLCKADAKQNRGLFAFINGNKIQISWRMRATDDPKKTKYCLYADNKLISISTKKTTPQLDLSMT